MKELYQQIIKSFGYIFLAVGLTLGFGTKTYQDLGENLPSYVVVTIAITTAMFFIKFFIAGLDYFFNLGYLGLKEIMIKRANLTKRKIIELEFKENNTDKFNKIFQELDEETLKSITKLANDQLKIRSKRIDR